MIIIKYLFRKISRNQLIIALVLFVIFFCQKLLRILDAAIEGKISTNFILSLLLLGVPETLQFILAPSLFLGLLITLSKLNIENEIIVMQACGFSNSILIKSAIILAFFSGIIAISTVMWIGPWSSIHQDKILKESTSSSSIASLVQGQFQKFSRKKLVLFIEKIHGNNIQNIFLAQFHSKRDIRPSVIIIAQSGQIVQRKNGVQIIILNKGRRFERSSMHQNFRITDFQDYQAIINRQDFSLNPRKIEQMYIKSLWNTKTNQARIELHWRITLVFSIFLMALMVVPLNGNNQKKRQRWTTTMLPALLLYLSFFLIQTSIKSNILTEKNISPIFWMWMVNVVYLTLAIILNLRDTVLIRKVRVHFM